MANGVSLLQVQNSVFDFLGTALVPVLGTDVATGAAIDYCIDVVRIK